MSLEEKNQEDCLPPELRGPATTITRVGAGMSGAGVYRVDTGGASYILKIGGDGAWGRAVAVQRAAGEAGVAPRVVHGDEARRAVVSEFVADRDFGMMMGNPSTRAGAITMLGQLLHRVHAVPLAADAPPSDGRAFLATIWAGLEGFAVPAAAREIAQRVLAEPAPARERLVTSHNDVNPTNLVFDGERLLLVDWSTCGANDPLYDLAAAAVFFRIDETALFAAYDGSAPPPRFPYFRRLVATLCGSMFLKLARDRGHVGGEGAITLADFYQRLRGGQVNIASADGQWLFGLALLDAARG